MTVLECDVAGSRVEAAQAADVAARLFILGQEIDRLAKEDRRLAEICGLDPQDVEPFEYPGLGEVLKTFQPGMLVGKGASCGKSASVTSLDHVLAVALVQREANLRSQADARRERAQLVGCRQSARTTVDLHQDLMTRWTDVLAQWDPHLRSELIRLEGEERALLQGLARYEAAEAAARDAENALNHLWLALHDAVDWVVIGQDRAGETPAPVLRSERLAVAEPWIFEVQILLARAHRALWDVEDPTGGKFQADILSRFAGWCIESMGSDVAERDGTSRSCRTVSWTMTTVLALRGYVTRSQVDVGRALDNLRLLRTKMLSRSRS